MSSLDSPLWVGPYRLTSRIATGGMAEVYVGRRFDPTTGKSGPMVAVKRLLPHLTTDPKVVGMFLNEARITAQIDHPNVVRIIDLGMHETEPYITMELLEGKSFAEMRVKAAEQGKRVPLGVTLRILTEACRGLDAAHRAVDEEGRPLCIVHRDFTPDNIHVGINGSVKVIDFGIAKAQHWGSGTEPGTLKGKFFYMSPEMIAGHVVDHRADLFAAGVMLYEQLCGRRPFTGNSIDEVVIRIAQGNPKRPTEFDPSVPPALEAICLMALQKDPQKRFPSLTELIGALQSVGGVAELATAESVGAYVAELFPATEDPKRQQIQRARQADPSIPAADRSKKASAAVKKAEGRRRWPLVLALSALVLAAGSGAGYWVWTRLRPELTPVQRLAAAASAERREEKIALLRPLAQDPGTTPAQLADAGNVLLAADALDEVLELAQHFQRRFPKEREAYELEARAATKLGKGKRAEVAIARIAELAPGDADPDLLLAELRELQGDSPGALEALNAAQKKRPDSTDIAGRRGYLLSQAGRLDEAGTALQQAVGKRFDAKWAAELAFVRFRQEQLEEAETLLRRALKKEGRLAVAHYYLGAVLYRRGDVKGAEKAYLQADRLSPADPRPLVALCEVQAQTKSASLEGTRKRIAERFPADSAKLLTSCAN